MKMNDILSYVSSQTNLKNIMLNNRRSKTQKYGSLYTEFKNSQN